MWNALIVKLKGVLLYFVKQKYTNVIFLACNREADPNSFSIVKIIDLDFLRWVLYADISDCISSTAFCQYHLASFKFKSIFVFRICAGNTCSFIVSTWKIQFLSIRKSVDEISSRFRNLFVTFGNFLIQYRIKCIVIMLFHIGSAIWFEHPRWCLHHCRPDIGFRKTSQNHKQ